VALVGQCPRAREAAREGHPLACAQSARRPRRRTPVALPHSGREGRQQPQQLPLLFVQPGKARLPEGCLGCREALAEEGPRARLRRQRQRRRDGERQPGPPAAAFSLPLEGAQATAQVQRWEQAPLLPAPYYSIAIWERVFFGPENSKKRFILLFSGTQPLPVALALPVAVALPLTVSLAVPVPSVLLLN